MSFDVKIDLEIIFLVVGMVENLLEKLWHVGYLSKIWEKDQSKEEELALY